jgi:hypothetical protein
MRLMTLIKLVKLCVLWSQSDLLLYRWCRLSNPKYDQWPHDSHITGIAGVWEADDIVQFFIALLDFFQATLYKWSKFLKHSVILFRCSMICRWSEPWNFKTSHFRILYSFPSRISVLFLLYTKTYDAILLTATVARCSVGRFTIFGTYVFKSNLEHFWQMSIWSPVYVPEIETTGYSCYVTVMRSLIVLVKKRADWNVPVSYIKYMSPCSACGFSTKKNIKSKHNFESGPFIHMTIGIFKEWLVKYFFVHNIVLKAILVF